MRQDLATYASDLKTEQDYAVSVMLLDLCSLCASWLTLHNTTVLLCCLAWLTCNAMQATFKQQLAATSAALQHAEKHHHSRVKELQKR